MDYWLLLFEDVFLTLCIVFTIFYNLFQVWNYFLGVIKMLLFLISTLFVSEIISVFGKSNRDLILFDVNKFLLDLLDQVEKYHIQLYCNLCNGNLPSCDVMHVLSIISWDFYRRLMGKKLKCVYYEKFPIIIFKKPKLSKQV